MIRINTHSRLTGRLEWADMTELRKDLWPHSEAYRPDFDDPADYVASLLDIPRQNVILVEEPPSADDWDFGGWLDSCGDEAYIEKLEDLKAYASQMLAPYPATDESLASLAYGASVSADQQRADSLADSEVLAEWWALYLADDTATAIEMIYAEVVCVIDQWLEFALSDYPDICASPFIPDTTSLIGDYRWPDPHYAFGLYDFGYENPNFKGELDSAGWASWPAIVDMACAYFEDVPPASVEKALVHIRNHELDDLYTGAEYEPSYMYDGTEFYDPQAVACLTDMGRLGRLLGMTDKD